MPAHVKMKMIMWLRKKFRDCAERSCVIAWMDKHAYDCVKIDKKMIVWMDTSLFSISDYVSPSPCRGFFQLGGHEWRPWRMARSKVLRNQSIGSTGTFGKSNVFRHRSNSEHWNISFYHDQWLLQMISYLLIILMLWNQCGLCYLKVIPPPPISLKKVTTPMILSFSQNYAINSVRFAFFLNFQDLVNFQSRWPLRDYRRLFW